MLTPEHERTAASWTFVCRLDCSRGSQAAAFQARPSKATSCWSQQRLYQAKHTEHRQRQQQLVGRCRSNSSCKLQAKTEARAAYKPPPPGTARQAPVKPPGSQIPKSDYPPVLQSVTRTDYQPDVLQRAGPPCRGSRPQDAGNPMQAAGATTPEYTTQAGCIFKAHSQEQWQEANSKVAGSPATHIVSYNIIHGGPIAAANPYEAFVAGHDYRRTRP